jgi:orotidine-5'-phosphate decarboxylase
MIDSEMLLDSRYDVVRNHTYLALDVPSASEALALVERFGAGVTGYKVGLELYNAAGRPVVETLAKLGKRIFLDIKLHDIPNTVAGALRALKGLPVEMVNVHTLGGLKMLCAAKSALEDLEQPPLLIGVTVLTSLSEEDVSLLGVPGGLTAWSRRLLSLADEAGLDGVVLAAPELPLVAETIKRPFVRVVPGVRPAEADLLDQQRIATPLQAVSQGADHLVLGRGVLSQSDPLRALQKVWDEMRVGLGEGV